MVKSPGELVEDHLHDKILDKKVKKTLHIHTWKLLEVHGKQINKRNRFWLWLFLLYCLALISFILFLCPPSQEWWRPREAEVSLLPDQGGGWGQPGRDLPRGHTGPRTHVPPDRKQVCTLWLCCFCVHLSVCLLFLYLLYWACISQSCFFLVKKALYRAVKSLI